MANSKLQGIVRQTIKRSFAISLQKADGTGRKQPPTNDSCKRGEGGGGQKISDLADLLSGNFPSVCAEDKGEGKLPKTGIVFHSAVEKAFECLQIAVRNGPKKIRALKVGQNTISRQHTRVLMTVGRGLSEPLSAASRKPKT